MASSSTTFIYSSLNSEELSEKTESIFDFIYFPGMAYFDASYYESLLNNPYPPNLDLAIELGWVIFAGLAYIAVGAKQIQEGKKERGIFNCSLGSIIILFSYIPFLNNPTACIPPLFILMSAADVWSAVEEYQLAPEKFKTEQLQKLIPKVISLIAWTVYALPTFIAVPAAICSPIGLALGTAVGLYYFFKPLNERIEKQQEKECGGYVPLVG